MIKFPKLSIHVPEHYVGWDQIECHVSYPCNGEAGRNDALAPTGNVVAEHDEKRGLGGRTLGFRRPGTDPTTFLQATYLRGGS